MSRSPLAVIGASIAGVFVFIGAFVLVIGGSMNRVDTSTWGCLYGGGPFEAKTLKAVIAPGTSGGFTVFDRLEKIPADNRFYYMDSDPNTADFGAVPPEIPVAGGVMTTTNIQIGFRISEDVCRLFEDQLRRNEPLAFNEIFAEQQQADGSVIRSPGGWARYLNLILAQQTKEAIRPIIGSEDYLDLYNNVQVDGTPIYDLVEQRVAAKLVEELGDRRFFCGLSYRFDGKADGEFDCPPLDVTVQSIVPKDLTLLGVQETLIRNTQEQRRIESEQKLARERSTEELRTLETTERNRAAAEAAKTEAQKTIDLANAAAQQEVVAAQQQVVEQERINAEIQAQADTAACRILLAAGQNCALYEAAKNGNYPQYIFGGDAAALVQVPR